MSARYKGPKLPNALVREMGGVPEAGSSSGREGRSGGRRGGGGGRRGGRGGGRAGPGGRGSYNRKEYRKQQRDDRKHKRSEHANDVQPARELSGQKRRDGPSQGAQQDRHKRQKHGSDVDGKPGKLYSKGARGSGQKLSAPAPRVPDATKPLSSKTKFHELLMPENWQSSNSREAFLEDLRMQQQLAKRLGKSKKDALDGMDALLEGISAGTQELLPDYLAADQGTVKQVLRSTAEAASKPAQPSKRQAPKPAARAGKGGKDDDAQGKDELEDETDSMYDDDDDDGSEGNGLEGFDSESMEAGSQGDSEQDSESDEDMFSEEGSEEEEDGLDDLMNGGSSSQEEVGVSGSGLESGEDEQASEGEEAGGSQEGGCLGDMPASGSEEPSEGNEEEELEEKDEQAAAKRSHGAGLGPGSVATANAKAVAPPAAAAAKYMPPALRAKLAAAAHESLAGAKGGEEAEQAALERRVTGLLNRLAEANMQGIAKDVVQLYSEAGRRRISDIVAAQILSACSEGPRASEQFTAVAAAFVSAVCALARAQDMAAAFLAALAERLEAARAQVDSLAQVNLVTLLGYCYSSGLVGPDLLYSFLTHLHARFDEADVSAMVTLLNAVGLQLRNDDPSLMKEFVMQVHAKAAELGKTGGLSKRATLMLDLIVDIKNNRHSAAGAKAKGAEGRRGGALAVLSSGAAKWVRSCGIDEICMRNLSWAKLLTPVKKGMWWLPAAGEMMNNPLGLVVGASGSNGNAQRMGSGASAGASAGATAGALLGGDGMLASDGGQAALLAAAAGQRLSTDARRAVFCAIMGSEDCVEAQEKLLRLPLKGGQEREVVRVLMECCMQERAWNPYYAFLALKLAQSSRAHRVTLQYSMWDQYKEIEAMDVRRVSHLARFNALLLARYALSLTTLKVVDFQHLGPKATFYWRLCIQQLLAVPKATADVKDIFNRLSGDRAQALASTISALLSFVRTRVGPWLSEQAGEGVVGPAGGAAVSSDELLRRLRVAEKVLARGASKGDAVAATFGVSS